MNICDVPRKLVIFGATLLQTQSLRIGLKKIIGFKIYFREDKQMSGPKVPPKIALDPTKAKLGMII